jgi:hypothetical protein
MDFTCKSTATVLKLTSVRMWTVIFKQVAILSRPGGGLALFCRPLRQQYFSVLETSQAVRHPITACSFPTWSFLG